MTGVDHAALVGQAEELLAPLRGRREPDARAVSALGLYLAGIYGVLVERLPAPECRGPVGDLQAALRALDGWTQAESDRGLPEELSPTEAQEVLLRSAACVAHEVRMGRLVPKGVVVAGTSDGRWVSGVPLVPLVDGGSLRWLGDGWLAGGGE